METSLCLDCDVKERIMEASYLQNISASKISKLLIKKILSHCSEVEINNMLTEYQSSNANMTILRYRLNEDERLLFSKARQRLCISVSKLLLVGFLLFFDELFKKKKKEETKYNYTSVKHVYFPTIINFLKRIKYYDKIT